MRKTLLRMAMVAAALWGASVVTQLLVSRWLFDMELIWLRPGGDVDWRFLAFLYFLLLVVAGIAEVFGRRVWKD